MLTTETFRKAARDPAEFGSYYLSHYFTRRSPPFHRQLSALWRRRVMKNRDPVSDCAAMLTEKGTRSAIAAPRGHAKSTVMSLQNVLHAALFGYKRYILLVSDTEAQAVSFLDAIKNELETNERILADFGEQPGKTWKTGSILLSNGCRIDAVGSGQKLRGRRNYERRPDLILCDDIENDEGVRTAEQRKIAGFAVGGQRVEIAHHALFHRSVVARRHANEDEAVVGTGLQSVISSFVGARELFAVGDPDAFHAPAAAKDAPLDRDAARGPCAGAPQRQQNCQ